MKSEVHGVQVLPPDEGRLGRDVRKERKLLKGANHEKIPLTHVCQKVLIGNQLQVEQSPANGIKVNPPRPLEREPRMAQHTVAMTFIRKKN